LPAENVVYSVRVRGIDTRHYDMVFGDEALVLKYLGEYWEKTRPASGLQRRADLLVYKLRKRRNRFSQEDSSDDIRIPYSMVRSYELRPPRQRKRWTRQSRGKMLQVETTNPVLRLELLDGRRLSIEFSPRVYELVKKLVKRHLGEGRREASKPGARERGRRRGGEKPRQ